MQWQEFEQTFPIQLNTQQKEAVQSVDGPVLLLAVPGSGKTTVLVTRLGYMVYCRGIPPENILTVTYTVAATGDMSRRCAAYFGEDLARRLEFRTINGICARILQYYGKCTGKTPFELATDERVTAEILSEIYRRVQREYPTESDLKNVRTMITYIKNMMLDQEQIRQLDEEAGFAISEMYREYCARLRERHLMDYDDQMVYAYQMLCRIPGLLAYFRKNIRISVSMRHRIPRRSSTQLSRCLHRRRRTCSWSEMRIRAFTASARHIPRRSCPLRRSIRAQRCC